MPKFNRRKKISIIAVFKKNMIVNILIIPSSLDSLKLRNFDLDVINSILNCSKNNLTSIKKL